VEPDTWNGLYLTVHPKLRQAVKKIIEWYQRGEGTLILAGNCGCGKTHLARTVFEKYGGPAFILDWSNEPVETIRNAVLYAENELFADIRQSYNSSNGKSEGEIIRQCCKAKLFILDDLGVAHIRDESSAWAHDIYWRIFDARINKFTLITTNLRINQIPARLGTRAFSRLMETLPDKSAYVDMFDIPDYRLRNWR
jgi:DNA replication protein DnaC